MTIPITVDNVTYRSTNELVKRLDFKVNTSILYRRFTSKKHTFTRQEIEEAVNWINENTKSKPKEKVINASSLIRAGTSFLSAYHLESQSLIIPTRIPIGLTFCPILIHHPFLFQLR